MVRSSEVGGSRRRLMAEVAQVVGSRAVEFVGEMPRGESRTTFMVVAGTEKLIVKLAPGGLSALENQQRLVRLVGGLRSRGYPAPENLGAGEAEGMAFTVQRVVSGETLEPGAGLPQSKICSPRSSRSCWPPWSCKQVQVTWPNLPGLSGCWQRSRPALTATASTRRCDRLKTPLSCSHACRNWPGATVTGKRGARRGPFRHEPGQHPPHRPAPQRHSRPEHPFQRRVRGRQGFRCRHASLLQLRPTHDPRYALGARHPNEWHRLDDGPPLPPQPAAGGMGPPSLSGHSRGGEVYEHCAGDPGRLRDPRRLRMARADLCCSTRLLALQRTLQVEHRERCQRAVSSVEVMGKH